MKLSNQFVLSAVVLLAATSACKQKTRVDAATRNTSVDTAASAPAA